MSDMSPDLRDRLVPRLIADYRFKSNGAWLQYGKCPSCGKKELFTRAENPWVLRCGRKNKCAAELSVQDLYPDEFGRFNERFQPTRENPTATADAYLRDARGLNVALMRKHRYYTQERFWTAGANRGTATVRFTIPGTDGAYMERFVAPVEIVGDGGTRIRKQNFSGKHGGWWWQPPEMTIESGDEVWITEAIIDSISLWQSGVKSVAILSCGNYPRHALEKLGHLQTAVRWIWALDNDGAGKTATQKHVARMRLAKYPVFAAQVPAKSKRDWNDLFKAGRLGCDDLATYRHRGALLIAESAAEKATLMYRKTRAANFVLDYANQLYLFKCAQEDVARTMADGTEELDAIRTAGTLSLICNARPEFLYFQRSEVTDESWIFAKIHFPDARAPMGLTFSPTQITAVSEFKRRLFSAHGAWWDGKDGPLNYIGKHWMNDLPRVDTIEYYGYSREYGAYVFPEVAVFDGIAYPVNDQDFFRLPGLSLKSMGWHAGMNISLAANGYRKDWAQLLWRAFGAGGVIAATFWFASLFAEQIRTRKSSFPFLEITGEPGSGKTTLIEFIWRVFGMDREGSDPNKATRAGIDRTLAQFAGLPTVFIEADRAEDRKSKRFDWDELKPLYNGRGMRIRGMKSSGNETYEPPFRGTLVIAQNDPVNASDAVLERIVQLSFKRAAHSRDSKAAIDEMVALDIGQLSHFVVIATRAARQVAGFIDEKTDAYQAHLLTLEGIDHVRLAKNHAQLIAAVEQFARLTGLTEAQTDETCTRLTDCCRQRQIAIAADHPVVAAFWDVYDYIDSRGKRDPYGNPMSQLNHSRNPETIAVNLNEFAELAALAHQSIPPLIDLKRLLKTSKTRKFIAASKTVCSAVATNDAGQPRTPRCWIFHNPTGVTS